MPRSLIGSRGSSFQPCIMPRRIKGFALRLVSGFEFQVPGFKPLRTLCSLRLKTLRLQTSDFQPNFRGSIHPLLHLLHFYTAKPTHTQLKTNLQAIWQIFCKQNPPLSKIIHRSSRYSRLPLPSIGLNSMRHIIRFPLQYGKFTSIIR